ncbi:spore germination protein [Paenibacillus sp. N3.4]|uniref:spore germination protein n=1 Tax=Paenibacillus sp. N3.4 TaxID=2603222 RepID=UPI0011CA3EB5|nr:spore germination protein [Paenibacillus sp. N3.4]TXK82487.1 spore germination protein [Paenibacillus sp. N3.4]
MNSFVGNIRINNVSNSSNVQVGDAAFIVLSSNTKMHAGANSFTPGDSFGTLTNNQNSSTNTSDLDVFDGTNIV